MTNTLEWPNAASLLQSLEEKGYEVAAPIDIDGIAELLGIAVEYDPTLESRNSIGEISFTGATATIRINPSQNSFEPRRRFTMAHEIGHFCLHSAQTRTGFSDSEKTMNRTDSYWDANESEANAFAAQLLMPKKLLLKEGKQAIEDYVRHTHSTTGMPTSKFVEVMSGLFGVSSKAMEYRLKNLRII